MPNRVYLLCRNGQPTKKAYINEMTVQKIRDKNQKQSDQRFREGAEGLDQWTVHPLIVVGALKK